MNPLDTISGLALPIVGAFAMLGTGLVVWLALRSRGAVKGKNAGAGIMEMTCAECQSQLIFHPKELVILSPPEMALVVGAFPDIRGHPLAEHVCPNCEAAHCFVTDAGAPMLVGVNIYEPQQKSSLCRECRRILKRPSWQWGVYDGRIDEIANLSLEYGLTCEKCQAACCIMCCNKATRNRTDDGSLLCPRCFRGPMVKVYHY